MHNHYTFLSKDFMKISLRKSANILKVVAVAALLFATGVVKAQCPPVSQTISDYTFSTAQDGDVSYFYISTHGLWEPGDPGNSMTLLLSNGRSQSGVTAQQLHDAFERIRGTKVLIVDACHAGAMIAKGIRDEFSHIFEGDSYKIICSSGGAEESWFWRGGATDEGVLAGGGYFSGVLSAGLSFQTGYAADENSDGSITLSEIKRYLRQMHGASTVHTYPEEDDFPILTYDASSVHRRTDGVGNIVFEEGLLSKAPDARSGRSRSVTNCSTRRDISSFRWWSRRTSMWKSLRVPRSGLPRKSQRQKHSPSIHRMCLRPRQAKKWGLSSPTGVRP